jgi:hypothetical protein
MQSIKHASDRGPIGNGAPKGFYAFPLLVVLSGILFGGLSRTAQVGPQSRHPASATPASSGPEAPRTKIAEGEYAIYEEGNSGAVGPLGEEIYDFHETWTLWRTARREYEIEGERKFESPQDVPHADRFLVQLSRDLTVIRLTEFAKLRWRSDSGPIRCEFLAKEFSCTSDARDPQQSIALHIPLEHPFGLLWPISPFSLSSLTRHSERDLSHGTHVQLLSIEQPSSYDPVRPTILDGQLQYLGEENIDAADQQWRAFKFSLKAPSHPEFLLWTSSKGILLALAIEHMHPNWPKEGMKLMRFKKWADF